MKASYLLGGTLLLSIASGCVVAPTRGRADIADALRERTGSGVPTESSGEEPFPDDVDPHDGLSEDEAVAVALWNNPGFHAGLAELGLARAELIQAGLLRNPVLSLLFPVGPKQLEAGITWPLESVWQRRRRVSIAQINVERVAEALVHEGLGLVLQVEIAYADLLLAGERAQLARERAGLLGEIGEIDRARLGAGDIGEIEADRALETALGAGIEANRKAGQMNAARARLLGLLGLAERAQIDLRPADSPETVDASSPDLPSLLARALAARPDLRAAELTIESAEGKSGLARSEFVSITGLVDYNKDGKDGSEIGPGIAPALPLFDRGQGDRARARAELERALSRYSEVRNGIAAQVREAFAQFEEARKARDDYLAGVVRLSRDAAGRTEKAHAAGDVSHQAALVSKVRLGETLREQAEVSAELRRARARLEYAIGSDLERTPGPLARAD